MPRTKTNTKDSVSSPITANPILPVEETIDKRGDILTVAMPMSNPSVTDLSAAFVAVLDNDEVVTKLARALSVTIELTLLEKLAPIAEKLDNIIKDHKSLSGSIAKVEHENAKLRLENDGLNTSVDALRMKLNQVEQSTRKNNVIINGIPESFAERAAPGVTGDSEESGDSGDPPAVAISREDTIKYTCTVINEACGLTITPSDIHSAFRLKLNKSDATGPRLVLVTFNSFSKRQMVIKARRPKQKLSFHGNLIYVNEHLTEINAKFARTARQFVKKNEAYASWTRDGQIFIKWSADSTPIRIQSAEDFL